MKPRFTENYRPLPDDRDQEILEVRFAAFEFRDQGPRVGDFVRFPGGIERRFSYIWPGESERHFQTSNIGCGYYLGNGYVDMGNGSLFVSVPESTITATDELKYGRVWFFHHDHHTGHNGVNAEIPHRVYECSREAPTS